MSKRIAGKLSYSTDLYLLKPRPNETPTTSIDLPNLTSPWLPASFAVLRYLAASFAVGHLQQGARQEAMTLFVQK